MTRSEPATQHPFDAITEQELRAAGSLKWTMFPDMIGAFVAEMDFGVAPAITQAVTESMDAGFTGYLAPAVATRLQEETARWHAEHYGWDIAADDVRLVPDVLAAFEFAITAHTSPGAAIIVPTPAYMPFLMVPQRLGRRVIEVPSRQVDGRWTMDLDAVASAFADGA